MKRMIISGVIGVADIMGYADTVMDLQKFEKTGIYPTPNIGLDLSQAMILFGIIFAASAVFFVCGLFAHKYNA